MHKEKYVRYGASLCFAETFIYFRFYLTNNFESVKVLPLNQLGLPVCGTQKIVYHAERGSSQFLSAVADLHPNSMSHIGTSLKLYFGLLNDQDIAVRDSVCCQLFYTSKYITEPFLCIILTQWKDFVKRNIREYRVLDDFMETLNKIPLLEQGESFTDVTKCEFVEIAEIMVTLFCFSVTYIRVG